MTTLPLRSTRSSRCRPFCRPCPAGWSNYLKISRRSRHPLDIQLSTLAATGSATWTAEGRYGTRPEPHGPATGPRINLLLPAYWITTDKRFPTRSKQHPIDGVHLLWHYVSTYVQRS